MPPAPRPVRVAIMNDYEIVVLGIAALLSRYDERIEVVELSNGMTVVSDVDIILFDTFANVTGHSIDLSGVVRPGGPKVVVFTWVADSRSAKSAIGQGAAGYLSKSLPSEDLVKALEDIHVGIEVVSGEDELASPVLDLSPGREFDLSPREAEMMALIAQGLSNDEMASALFLSVNSIKTYIRTAYRKIGVTTRAQAVVWAIEHGFTAKEQRSNGSVEGVERRNPGTHPE